jgi:hypothetical protein
MNRSLCELVANDALDCADFEIIELADQCDDLVASGLGALVIEEVEAALRAADYATAEPAS